MNHINAKEIRVLDAKKLSKSGSGSVRKYLDSITQGPSIIMTKNLDTIDSTDEDEYYKILNEIVTEHSEHVFLVEEKCTDQFIAVNGDELPDNVWFGQVVTSAPIVPRKHKGDTPSWVVITKPYRFKDYHGLEEYNWIIIDSSAVKNSAQSLKAIALIIRHCNTRSLCVSTYPNINLEPLNKLINLLDVDSFLPLYYQLPITNSYILMNVMEGMEEQVDIAKKNLNNWLTTLNTATMVVAYVLYKLVTMSRHVGQTAFWLTYFDVPSAKRFAASKLELSRSQMYRYIQAAEVCENLFPGMMDKVIAKEKTISKRTLRYSRFLVPFPYLHHIENSSDELKKQLRRMLLDEGATASEIESFLFLEFGDNKKKHITNKQYIPAVFDVVSYLDNIHLTVMQLISESDRIYLEQHLKAIHHMILAEIDRRSPKISTENVSTGGAKRADYITQDIPAANVVGAA